MKILISLLGSTLDAHGRGQGRWGVWRPSVALAMQEDLHFDRYHLVYQPEFARLKDEVAADIRAGRLTGSTGKNSVDEPGYREDL